MTQKIKNDHDAESMIEMLYLISDALHLVEDASLVDLESTDVIREMLVNAQLLTIDLLTRVSGHQSSFLNESIMNGSAQQNKLVLVYKTMPNVV